MSEASLAAAANAKGSKSVPALEVMRVVPPTIIPLLVIAARRQRILRKFREAGADQPERARTFAELGVEEGLLTSRMSRSGVLATADGVRYFVSADGLARSKRRIIAGLLTALGALAVVALALLLLLRVG